MPWGPIAITLLYSFRVWQRNRDSFFRQSLAEAGGFVIEPLILLTAMGYGLGPLVGDVGGISYAAFVAPGILAGYAMFHASFESTFGAYLRMETDKIYAGIIATPVNVEEVAIGEAAWSATRAVLAGVAVLTVAALFGLVQSPLALLALPVAFLVGLVFASMALMLVAVAPSIGTLNNFFTVFTAPMFFFAGVFFPLDQFPDALQPFVWALPLTQGAHIIRGLMQGELDIAMVWSLLALMAYAAVALPIAARLLRRRLVK